MAQAFVVPNTPRSHQERRRTRSGLKGAFFTDDYADFGKIGSFLPLQQQNQQLFAVTDFKISKIDIELGAGYGFTPGSDRFTLKAIIGYAFPAPNNGGADSSSPSPLKMGAPSRLLPNAWAVNPADQSNR
jgi:hypothetical protein